MEQFEYSIMIAIIESLLLITIGLWSLKKSYLAENRTFVYFRFFALVHGVSALIHYIHQATGLSALDAKRWWLISRADRVLEYSTLAVFFAYLLVTVLGASRRKAAFWAGSVFVASAFLLYTPFSSWVRDLPMYFYTPFNITYYVPRFLLFGVMAAMLPRVWKSRSFWLIGISAVSSIYVFQDLLKMYISYSHFAEPWLDMKGLIATIRLVQRVFDTTTGLILAVMLFLGLHQNEIELVVLQKMRKLTRSGKEFASQVASVGFLQYFFVGVTVAVSKDEGLQEGWCKRNLFELLTTTERGQKEMLQFDDIKSAFVQNSLAFIKFIEVNKIRAYINGGTTFYKREDLLRATQA